MDALFLLWLPVGAAAIFVVALFRVLWAVAEQ